MSWVLVCDAGRLQFKAISPRSHLVTLVSCAESKLLRSIVQTSCGLRRTYSWPICSKLDITEEDMALLRIINWWFNWGMDESIFLLLARLWLALKLWLQDHDTAWTETKPYMDYCQVLHSAIVHSRDTRQFLAVPAGCKRVNISWLDCPPANE